MQSRPVPPYLLALVGLAADEPALERLAVAVARDVARPREPGEQDVVAARASVEWLIRSLHGGPVPDRSALRTLREDAVREAREGRPLQVVLDRTLSAGWVLWADATSRGVLGAEALAALGEALLRTGDAAAAAIAEGHAAAEQELARRSASAFRELLDELLELSDADDAGRARLVRRLAEAGIRTDRALTVIVVDAGRDLQDGDPAVVEVARRLGRGSVAGLGDPRPLGGPVARPVVATTHGRLVALLPAGSRTADAVEGFVPLDDWIAVAAEAAGLLSVARAGREAAAGLPIAARTRPRRTVVPAPALALERALLAEPALLCAGVDHELGPIAAAPRSARLVDTLEAYLGERENVRATARRLGVAPRTIAYRLERIERLLGGRLDADRRLRLAAVLFARRLL